MKRHKNGSVTLTAAEIAELNQAYQYMREILRQLPGDLLNDQELYTAIERWSEQLQGREYTEWEDPEWGREFEDYLEEKRKLDSGETYTYENWLRGLYKNTMRGMNE